MKKMKTIILTIFILLLIAALCFAGYAAMRYHQLYHPVTYQAASYSEQAAVLPNPYCGYYQMYGFTLSDEGIPAVQQWSDNILSHNSSSLVLLQINLRNYSDSDISAPGLEQLDYLLKAFCEEDLSLIVRFLYDWDGKAKETEPSTRAQIETHMAQIAPSVNAHTDSILTLQGVFTGNCGEMNNTHYGSFEDVAALMTTLSEVIDPQIYLAVRTPSQLRGVTENPNPVALEEAWNGTLFSRLGLYNDGMLGSVYDLGTYDDTPRGKDAPPSDKGTREEEIAFQKQLCQYVPNGGEVVLDNPYNDLPTALTDLANMHITYLNGGHDAAVMEKWKSSTYEGNDVFSGWNGYEYVEAHLGYRYLVTDSAMEFDTFHDDAATLSFTMANTGFAPAYRKFDSLLTIINKETQTILSLPLEWDNRTLSNETVQTITTSIPVREMEAGNYTIILSMSNPADGRTIVFANQTKDAGSSVELGSFLLE